MDKVVGSKDTEFPELREAMRDLCSRFKPEYHRQHDADATYPTEFIDALTKAGWLASMIPEEFGGSGLGLTEASIVMEEINRSGGNAGHCHGPNVQYVDPVKTRIRRTEISLPTTYCKWRAAFYNQWG